MPRARRQPRHAFAFSLGEILHKLFTRESKGEQEEEKRKNNFLFFYLMRRLSSFGRKCAWTFGVMKGFLVGEERGKWAREGPEHDSIKKTFRVLCSSL